jgi:hypothetical protein
MREPIRLYEEVLTRLDEMAMITARTLGMPLLVGTVSPWRVNKCRAVSRRKGPNA